MLLELVHNFYFLCYLFWNLSFLLRPFPLLPPPWNTVAVLVIIADKSKEKGNKRKVDLP